jgi:hypothetical protein
MGQPPVPKRRRLISLAVGVLVWLPLVHLVFRPRPWWRSADISPYARALAGEQRARFADPVRRDRELGAIRAANPEWDLMARSFFVWSMAELATRDPSARKDALAAMDEVIADTRRLERERGYVYFLLPYGHNAPFVVGPQTSQFLDGEIALMLASRSLVERRAEDLAELATRVQRMTARMEKSPVLSAESYPDECWTFCNTVALAAIRLHDRLTGEDHGDLLRRWVATAKKKLVHQPTGLLVSSYTLDGHVLDGPEGSTIWLSAHMLKVVDEDFARDQFERARGALVHRALGFAWAGEWPSSARGSRDVDSGPVIPLVDASPSSSGFAILAARSFGDEALLGELATTLEFAAFPTHTKAGLRYSASNPVGDSVLLYSTLAGVAWR